MTDGKKIGRTVTAYPPDSRPQYQQSTVLIYPDARKPLDFGGGYSVEDETTWGITPDAGSSTYVALMDHTHGSPDDPRPFSVAMAVALGGG